MLMGIRYLVSFVNASKNLIFIFRNLEKVSVHLVWRINWLLYSQQRQRDTQEVESIWPILMSIPWGGKWYPNIIFLFLSILRETGMTSWNLDVFIWVFKHIRTAPLLLFINLTFPDSGAWNTISKATKHLDA